MAGRRRIVVLAGVLIVALAGATAFASRTPSDETIGAEGGATAGSEEVAASATDGPLGGSSPPVVPGPPTTTWAGGVTTPSELAASTAATAESTTTRPPASPTPAPAPAAADKPAGGAAPLAGRIEPGVTYSGVATFYDADGGGACLYDPGADLMVAAMNTRDYETAKACGARVRVSTGSGASVTVRIVDDCPGECQVGQIDVSQEAFARLADPQLGRIPITWNLVSPEPPGPLSIRYKDGSSQYWCGIQVIDHRNPVARLEVPVNGAYKALERTGYNRTRHGS